MCLYSRRQQPAAMTACIALAINYISTGWEALCQQKVLKMLHSNHMNFIIIAMLLAMLESVEGEVCKGQISCPNVCHTYLVKNGGNDFTTTCNLNAGPFPIHMVIHGGKDQGLAAYYEVSETQARDLQENGRTYNPSDDWCQCRDSNSANPKIPRCFMFCTKSGWLQGSGCSCGDLVAENDELAAAEHPSGHHCEEVRVGDVYMCN